MKVRSLKLQDVHFGNTWFDKVVDHWDYDDLKANPDWRKGWISMDCALYDSADDLIYLGITSFDSDIFKAYDRKKGKFVDLGYKRIADPFDGKFHRALAKGKDGCIYAAIALLHDVDKFAEAPGGALVKYDPKSASISKLCIPLPHVYIQSLALDNSRDIIYCCCFTPEHLVSFNLRTGWVRDYGLIGSGCCGIAQGECIVIDDDGCVWSNWSLTRAWQSDSGVDAQRLCKLDVRQDKIIFYQKGLPMPDGSHGFAKAECFFNFHDGCIYASGANGSLYRIDPKTGDAGYLFTPVKDRRSRLASMVLSKDGCAYGVTGRDGKCELLKFDFRKDKYSLLGPIVDEKGEPCWQVHDIVIADDQTLYACENDNPHRSGYLWEIRID